MPGEMLPISWALSHETSTSILCSSSQAGVNAILQIKLEAKDAENHIAIK